ncbi:MAG: phosphotransferase enzyme family protein [Tenuifilaceae bacterium]
MHKSIVNSFDIKGNIIQIEPFGSGHINDTYRVILSDGDSHSFILQRVNHHIFPDIDKLSSNIQRVTNHLQASADKRFQVMSLIPAKDKKLSVQTEDGNFWRLFTFIPDSQSFDLAPSASFAIEAGTAYGWFIKTLSNLPEPRLYEIIPGFHNLGLRISQLKSALAENKADRARSCNDVVDFYISRCNEMIEFDSLVGTKEVPLRITHNDTKINNVLFSSDGKAKSVIDLDTVMPGIVHYDFGDAIRTISATALEDENDLSLVGINIELYKAFTKGFLKEVGESLTSTELKYLPKAPRMMAFIMGIRFLADYLRGDTYYKVKHPEHNIQRAKNQMALMLDMERKADEMRIES